MRRGWRPDPLYDVASGADLIGTSALSWHSIDVPGSNDTSNEMPDNVEALKQRLQVSEAERDLLKLMVAKLQLQLAKRNRALYGMSSERFDACQGSLIDAGPLDDVASRKAATTPAANNAQIDRSLPAHLPRDIMSTGQRLSKRTTTPPASPVVAAPAAGGCAASAWMSPNTWSTCLRASR